MGVGDIIATIISGLTFLWTIFWTIYSECRNKQVNEKFMKEIVQGGIALKTIASVIEECARKMLLDFNQEELSNDETNR